MFRAISWGQYLTFLTIGLILFYSWLHRRFRIFDPTLQRIARLTRKAPKPQSDQSPTAEPNPPKEPEPNSPPPKPSAPTQTTLFILALLATTTATAQNADGNAGINQANTLIRSYFTTAIQLMYAISGIVALAGAIHVYVKMLRSHHDTQQAAAAWFAACLFIAITATVIQFFFGL